MDVPRFSVLKYPFYNLPVFPLLLSSCFCIAELQPLTERGLTSITAQADLPSIPLLEGLDFNVQASGIEIDLDVQADIGSIQWVDDNGIGTVDGIPGQDGALILKGVHIGSSESPITAEMVRDPQPFLPSQLAQIHGMLIEADPDKGTLITINEIGDTDGNGLDLIINDIYFGRDLSEQGVRGWGLLVEDLSNFVSDAYVESINAKFGLSLMTVDDGKNTLGGNYYPIKLRMQPIEGGQVNTNVNISFDDNLDGNLEDLIGFGSLGQTSMILDAQFVVYVDKIAVYRENWEAGIEGLLIYQGIDSNGDGVEDLIGPATLTDMRMETIDHKLADGTNVQAMHFSNIDFKADIAMENIYLGNPKTGSIGAIHIDDLHIHDTQMWIYAHD